MRRSAWVMLAAAVIAGGLFSPRPSRVPGLRDGSVEAQAAEPACAPTPPDAEGPFYKADAPERLSIGRGLVVAGTVRTAGGCAPIPGARIEWWQADSRGQYDDAHRASQSADREGKYRFETSFPGLYPGRPPHVHVKVAAPGHRTLITQLYPKQGQTELPFDFVLRPQ